MHKVYTFFDERLTVPIFFRESLGRRKIAEHFNALCPFFEKKIILFQESLARRKIAEIFNALKKKRLKVPIFFLGESLRCRKIGEIFIALGLFF